MRTRSTLSRRNNLGFDSSELNIGGACYGFTLVETGQNYRWALAEHCVMQKKQFN